MIHLCRDFLTQHHTYSPQYALYLTSLFLRRVLNFSVVGQTNFDIDSITYTLSSGTGTILGWTSTRIRKLIPGIVVNSSHIGKIVAIRSNTLSMYHSGLFRIQGFDSVDNSWIIDLRTGDQTPQDVVTWSLHTSEANLQLTNGANSNVGQYRTRDSATSSRIILQSPHSSAWQVRLAYESSQDYGTTRATNNPGTIAPGFEGNSNGDFAAYGLHLHGAMWHNSNAQTLLGTTVGLSATFTTTLSYNLYRIFMVGDDETGNCCVIIRHNNTFSNGSMSVFGLSENTALSARDRLFVVGHTSDNTENLTSQINVNTGTYDRTKFHGVALSRAGRPIPMSTSNWVSLGGQSQSSNSYRFNTIAAINYVTSDVVTTSVDLIAGTWDRSYLDNDSQIYVPEVRLMGTMPIIRVGPSQVGNWTIVGADDDRWLHTMNGIFIPWMGRSLP